MQSFTVDPDVYPTLAAYLALLPDGLDSYPDIRTRSTYNLLLRRCLGGHLTHSSLPGALVARLTEPWGTEDWIPTTIYAVLSALAKDKLWQTEPEFHAGMARNASIMYNSLFFRAIMKVLSPSLLLMGSAKRWGAFHQGTTLTVVSQGKPGTVLDLSYPAPLFDMTTLQSLGAVFCAAASGAGARAPVARVVVTQPGSARFTLTWT